MPKLLERRKKFRRKAVHVTGPTWVMLENVPGARADIRAKVVDFNETGLRIPLTVAETPARESGRGRVAADCVEGASYVPKTLRIAPGANACWNEAPLLMPPIVIVEDGPTMKMTGIFIVCGVAFWLCRNSVAV